jgi:diaminopropionate ammonia-lyase
MPKGSTRERLEHIRALGADAEITEVNYDDTVRLCAAMAEEHGWHLIQDTAWDGYEQIPLHIMQGYMTMAAEAWEQMGGQMPTHIFLQAGVGSMAAAQTAFFRSLPGGDRPVICVVEPDRADCLFRSAGAGEIRTVTGDMDSIMAGLCCGEPCTLAWKILKDHADHFITFPDYGAARGMRILGNPMPGDDRVTSGESGASAFGAMAAILSEPELAPIKEELGLDENSRVFVISTEGDTDRENYRKIVWDGKLPG